MLMMSEAGAEAASGADGDGEMVGGAGVAGVSSTFMYRTEGSER